MLPAVQLNNQMHLQAHEIDYITTDWMLTSELVSAEPTVTQSLPETALGISSSLT